MCLDMKKAFDLVPQEAILHKWHLNGVPNKMVNLMRAMYMYSTCQVLKSTNSERKIISITAQQSTRRSPLLNENRHILFPETSRLAPLLLSFPTWKDFFLFFFFCLAFLVGFLNRNNMRGHCL